MDHPIACITQFAARTPQRTSVLYLTLGVGFATLRRGRIGVRRPAFLYRYSVAARGRVREGTGSVLVGRAGCRFWFRFMEPNQGQVEFGDAEGVVGGIALTLDITRRSYDTWRIWARASRRSSQPARQRIGTSAPSALPPASG